MAALYLGKLCDVRPRPPSQRPIQVRIEAPEHVDDIVVTFQDGHRLYIQAKESVRLAEDAGKKLWRDFLTQVRSEGFTSCDLLQLEIGLYHPEHDELRELCLRARHSEDLSEWLRRLSGSQRNLLQRVEAVLAPERCDRAELFRLMRHVEVVVQPLGYLELELVQGCMPESNEPPQKLFRLLRDRVGGSARVRAIFCADGLVSELAQEGVRLSGSPGDPRVRLLEAVRTHARIARKALDPAILQRLARPGLTADWAAVVSETLDRDQAGVLLVVGPAGYGKTTLLGELYDRLAGTAGWVGVVRCSELPAVLNEQTLGAELGRVLCGQRRSLVDLSAELQQSEGRGVLLIDTLDLILSERLLPELRRVLLYLVDHLRVAVALTCRDFDHNQLLEPYYESLPGLSLCPRRVPAFTDAEVLEAATQFFQRNPDLTPPAGGRAFAERIVQLSAGNLRQDQLHQITHSPLLLGLLCELFGEDGVIPEDLTVSKLYNQYWERRIRTPRQKPRSDRERYQRRRARERLCLDVAERLYRRSATHFQDTLAIDALPVDRDRLYAEAFRDLQSEAVLVDAGNERVRFFHQTFLEYAIARWLSGPEAEPARTRLLSELETASPDYQQWWPVIRQYLTLVSSADFPVLSRPLAASGVVGFRAVALAAVARSDSSEFLRELQALATRSGRACEDVLLQALESAPRPLADLSWCLICDLLRTADRGQATRVAFRSGERLRAGELLSGCLTEALAAIAERKAGRAGGEGGADDRSEIAGKLLDGYGAAESWGQDERVRATIRQWYPVFGSETRQTIIRIHLEHAAEEERFALLRRMLPAQLPRESREVAAGLLRRFLPKLLKEEEIDLWEWWLRGQEEPLPPAAWPVVFARVMGRCAQDDPEVIRRLVEEVLTSDASCVKRSLIALSEGFQAGGADRISTVVREMIESAPAVEPGRRKSLSRFLPEPPAMPSAAPATGVARVAPLVLSQLAVSRSTQRPQALAAARQLRDLASSTDPPPAHDLLPLLEAPVPGVRQYGTQALLQLVKRGCPLGEQQLIQAARLLGREQQHDVAQAICELTWEWIRDHRRVPQEAIQAVGELAGGATQNPAYDGGTARFVIAALSAAAPLLPDALLPQLGTWARCAWISIEFQRVRNWFPLVQVFVRVAEREPAYLAALLRDAERFTPSDRYKDNVHALQQAIRRVEGRQSELLTQMLQSSWCPDEVKAEIAAQRGLR